MFKRIICVDSKIPVHVINDDSWEARAYGIKDLITGDTVIVEDYIFWGNEIQFVELRRKWKQTNHQNTYQFVKLLNDDEILLEHKMMFPEYFV